MAHEGFAVDFSPTYLFAVRKATKFSPKMATVKSPTHTIVIFLRTGTSALTLSLWTHNPLTYLLVGELIEEESHCPKLAVLGKLADTVHEIQKRAYVLLVMPGDALRHGISSHDFGFACHCQGSAHANPMASVIVER